MTNVDILLLVVILLSAVIGLMRGLFKEVFSLATWVGAFLVAMYFAPSMSEALSGQFANATLRNGIAVVLLFVLTLIVGSMVSFLVSKLLTSSGLSGTDRFFGFCFGAVRGAIVCIVALIALRSFAEESDWWQASSVVQFLMGFEATVLDWLGRAGGAVSDLQDTLEGS